MQINEKVCSQHSIIMIVFIDIAHSTDFAINSVLIENGKCYLSKVRMSMLLHPITDFVIRLVEKGGAEVRHWLAITMGDGVQIGGLEDTRCSTRESRVTD